MVTPADFHVERADGGVVAILTGDWTAVELGAASKRLADTLAREPDATVDLAKVGRFDTSGAYSVLKAVRRTGHDDRIVASPEIDRLLKMVGARRAGRRRPRPGTGMSSIACSSASAGRWRTSASASSTPMSSTDICWWPWAGRWPIPGGSGGRRCSPWPSGPG